jgi:hypothetical protein
MKTPPNGIGNKSTRSPKRTIVSLGARAAGESNGYYSGKKVGKVNNIAIRLNGFGLPPLRDKWAGKWRGDLISGCANQRFI